MAKNKKPTKKYVPKPVRPPVTKGLFDDLGRDMHYSILSFQHGGASMEGWKKITKALMTLSYATDADTRIDKADKVAIDSAVLTLKHISDLQVRTGKWHVSSVDIISLERGATAADNVLPFVDYRKLKHGYLTFMALTQSLK